MSNARADHLIADSHRCARIGFLVSIVVFGLVSSASANDDLVAHRLFEAGRFAEAAEIYTDPAWKGVAFYRSAQWWRAAEAFVRSDDADSLFNLGNTYVKLGYYALALDAYNAALSRQPEFEDAVFNRDLMRALLATDEENDSEAATTQQGEKIDQIDSESGDSGDSSEGEDDDADNRSDQNSDREGDTDDRGASPDAVSPGSSSEAGSDKTLKQQEAESGGVVKGTESEDYDSQDAPSGGSEGKKTTEESRAGGSRTELLETQAREQFLNQIHHDLRKYLRTRIEAEISLRAQKGQAAAEGGSQW